MDVIINVPKGSKSIYETLYPDYVIKEIILKGDVNNDGYVTAADVTALANYLVGRGTLANEAAAYVNDDDKIDIADLAALIKLVK